MIQLTKQQQGLANAGTRSKVFTSHLNSVSLIQPVSKHSVPFQDSVYHVSNVQGMSGQHSVLLMASNSDAQLTQQGIPGAGLTYNPHSLAPQPQQVQVAQMEGQGVQQDNSLMQGVTVNSIPI